MRCSLSHIVRTVIRVLAVGTAASGCAVVGALRGSAPPPLEVPAAPPRVVAAYPAETPEPDTPTIEIEEPVEDVPTKPAPEPIPEPAPRSAPAPQAAPEPEPDAQANLPELRPAPPTRTSTPRSSGAD